MAVQPVHPNNNKSYAKFLTWLRSVDTEITADSSVTFELGTRKPLGDGTISVPIQVARDGEIIWYTRFYFHYHPGANGPGVGNPNASVGHFKPNDGGVIRVFDYNVSSNPHLKALWKAARDKARKR